MEDWGLWSTPSHLQSALVYCHHDNKVFKTKKSCLPLLNQTRFGYKTVLKRIDLIGCFGEVPRGLGLNVQTSPCTNREFVFFALLARGCGDEACVAFLYVSCNVCVVGKTLLLCGHLYTSTYITK